MSTLKDLESLPPPKIIEEIDFEQILAQKKQIVLAKKPELQAAMALEQSAQNIILQPGAYREMLLRQRGNAIARARYLYFAQGSEIDHLGFFYDCIRMVGESDERYKQRIVLAIQGRSTGGTEPRYKLIAMSASLRVADAVVYTEGFDPTIKVAIFATDNNGVADAALITQVETALNHKDRRMVNDIIQVRSAVINVVNVNANIVLFPGTSSDIVSTIKSTLPTLWRSESGLGRDLTTDWLRSKMMQPGVYGVDIVTPAQNVVMQPFEAVRIGTVTITVTRRDY